MLTAKEKRFIRYWEEQRKGGKWKYYLLYILTGTFITAVVISFLMSMLLMRFVTRIPYVFLGSFFLVSILTIFSWMLNEKRFKRIIRREVQQGRSNDEQVVNAPQ